MPELMILISEGALEVLLFTLRQIQRIWPLLLITIPLAAAIRLSNVGPLLNRIMGTRPFVSILLATLFGALSPLCSCSVIPVVTGLLISGVPLAPVMSFWLASPSMDPEIFFLSVSTLGWDLAVWRIAGTFAMSLGGGLATHGLMRAGLLPASPLKRGQSATREPGGSVSERTAVDRLAAAVPAADRSAGERSVVGQSAVQQSAAAIPVAGLAGVSARIPAGAAESREPRSAAHPAAAHTAAHTAAMLNLTVPGLARDAAPGEAAQQLPGTSCCCSARPGDSVGLDSPLPPARGRLDWGRLARWLPARGRLAARLGSRQAQFLHRLLRESLSILLWLGKFMIIAFVLEAVIVLYLPEAWITTALGSDSRFSLLVGLGIGLPLYTSTLAALGIAGGLLSQGMSGGAALAFLIGGATTTIPAMTAVWGIARGRVFAAYLGFTAAGALATGLLYQISAAF